MWPRPTGTSWPRRRQADESDKRLQPLRELVLDLEFFGHTPKD
jgi:hypothetical protein